MRIGRTLGWARDPGRRPRSVSPHTHLGHATTFSGGPDDPGRPRRLACAALLKRAWRIDALVCPRCGGEMGLVAVILDPAVAEKIIGHLGLASRAPPRRLAAYPASQDAPLVD